MKFWSNINSSQSYNISAIHLWWLPALFPLLAILSSYIHGTWSWGLMDDPGMVSRAGTVWERFSHFFSALLNAGRLNPTISFHNAFFYRVFEDSPRAFYIFRWLEIILALSCWGLLASKATQKKIAFPLFVTVALSFLKFYDSFFFLSAQEILGILFSGAGLLCFFNAFQPLFEKTGRSKKGFLCLGIILLLLAVWSKEPFVAVGIALGGSLIVSGLKDRSLKGVLPVGGIMAIFSIGYALFLKICIAKGYSADYAITGDEISGNFHEWFSNVFIHSHLVWIGIGLFVLLMGKLSQTAKEKNSKTYFWMLIFGILSYVLYLLLILPWSGGGHYVAPLGVFFAFGIAVVLAKKMSTLRVPVMCGLVFLSLIFNIYVGGKALNFHALYQYDTANLLTWLSENTLFKHEVLDTGAVVRCNANEPSVTLHKLLEMQHEAFYPKFVFTAEVGRILKDPQTKYYIWSPSWGNQDLRRLGNMWTPMFVSESWIVFRRMR